MSDPIGLALTALALPLAAAVLAAVMGCTRALARFAHVPVMLAFGAAAVLALMVLAAVNQSAAEGAVAHQSAALTWFSAGGLNVSFSVTVDPLSTVMLCTVTFVATWIAIFSASYMHGDPGFARYFALMALFVFSMLLLVLANNFFLLLAGWEGVGLCSYLLVGYYYAKPSAAAAARKAFLVTRLGDVGFVLGILLLWQHTGSVDFDTVFNKAAESRAVQGVLTAACLLLFCGAVGKSAQLPLYVWLPDAMEGPTPVSALIHAATMVTAGVYLLARTAPLFVMTATAQEIVCIVGGLTALLAAFIALAQTDLKRVLAYSTVSQLGFMFMALGTAIPEGPVAPNVAVAAAVFHLFTHAFFKALLFLGSGSVMHAMGNVIDMRRFGGLKSVMPVTRWTFLVGSAALAGVPLLSGFWSKDQILDTLYAGFHSPNRNQSVYLFVYVVATLTAFLTAFYTFRAYFLTFHGEERVPPEAGHHAHESPWPMTLPLVVLAVGAAVAGLAVEAFGHQFSGFLAKTPSVLLANKVALGGEAAAHPHLPHFDWTVGIVSSVVALLGVGLAWRLYGAGGPEQVPQSLRGAYTLSQNKLYVDEVYHAAVVQPAEWAAALGRQADALLEGLARFVGYVPRFAGAAARPLQNGLIQFYALGMALGLAVFLTVVVFRTTR